MNRIDGIVFDYPAYYDIAFSFRDIPHEVDLIQNLIRQYSSIHVKSILELGCGSAPHMPELLQRGFHYTGLDASGPMLEAAQRRANESESRVSLIRGDMLQFELPDPVDFCFTLLGSLAASDTGELNSHLQAIARVLRSGGLYLLDWCVQFDPMTDHVECTKRQQGQIKIKTHYSRRYFDPVGQRFHETIALTVRDHGRTTRLRSEWTRRAIFPQEFLLLIEERAPFEFIGWWNDWDLDQPLTDNPGNSESLRIRRPIAVIRRR